MYIPQHKFWYFIIIHNYILVFLCSGSPIVVLWLIPHWNKYYLFAGWTTFTLIFFIIFMLTMRSHVMVQQHLWLFVVLYSLRLFTSLLVLIAVLNILRVVFTVLVLVPYLDVVLLKSILYIRRMSIRLLFLNVPS